MSITGRADKCESSEASGRGDNRDPRLATATGEKDSVRLLERGYWLCDHGRLVMPETTLQPSDRNHDAEDHKDAH